MCRRADQRNRTRSEVKSLRRVINRHTNRALVCLALRIGGLQKSLWSAFSFPWNTEYRALFGTDNEHLVVAVSLSVAGEVVSCDLVARGQLNVLHTQIVPCQVEYSQY